MPLISLQKMFILCQLLIKNLISCTVVSFTSLSIQYWVDKLCSAISDLPPVAESEDDDEENAATSSGCTVPVTYNSPLKRRDAPVTSRRRRSRTVSDNLLPITSSQGTNSIQATQIKPPAHKKLRWTNEERELLFQTFGAQITNKVMPNGRQLTEVAAKMQTRTVAQIRTQINNYINGKTKIYWQSASLDNTETVTQW